MTARVLVARLDSDGDVLLAGPAVRAAAAGLRGRPTEVSLLCGPEGAQAAGLLPGVARVLRWHCPWIAPQAEPVNPDELRRMVRELRQLRFDLALILTSAHQSALPLALLLRMAGVPVIVGISADYPGSLLDVRLRPDIDIADDLPEPERALAVASAAGFRLPPGDAGALSILPPPDVAKLVGPRPYLVLHPGASVPARSWPRERCREAVDALRQQGHRVVVTGGPGEADLTEFVAGRTALNLGGRTSFAQLAGVLAGADAVVVGNTAPAHLAAAVGTPVVSLFAPVLPAQRWAPYRVPHVLLGDQSAPCRGTRVRTCPVPGHPCLASVTAQDVVSAVAKVVGVSV